MKKKFYYRIVYLVLLFANGLLLAQGGGPPNPPGGGGTDSDADIAKNPIDMYEYILIIAAIFLIIYFYKRSKKLKLS